MRRRGYFFCLLREAGEFFAGLADLTGLATTGAGLAGGASPSADLSGQILKAGHFWQPTAIAMGQIFMRFLNQAPVTPIPLNSPVAMRFCHSAGPVMWALVPPESTATVTGMSTTSNS